MELLYYWIDEDKTFVNDGVHLSNRFEFDLVSEKDEWNLNIVDDEKYLPNFYGNHIINLTAIIGENGAGKSNLLYGLISRLTGYKHIFGNNYLLAFYSDSKIFIYESITVNGAANRLNVNCNTNFEINKVENHQDFQGSPIMNGLKPSQTEIIYFNPIYDLRDYPFDIEERNFADVSSSYLLWKDKENVNPGDYDMVATHRFRETLRQFRITQSPFLKDVDSIDEVSLPDEIEVEILRTNKIEKTDLFNDSRYLHDNIRKLGSNVLQVHNGEREKHKRGSVGYKKAIREKAKTWLLINFIDHFFYCYASIKDYESKLLQVERNDLVFFRKRADWSDESKWPNIDIKDFKSLIFEFFNKQKFVTKSEFDIVTNIEQMLKIIEDSGIVAHDNSATFNFPFSPAFKFLAICDKYAQVFNNKSQESISRAQWRNMSSGELSFLNLFARIFHGYDELVNINTTADKYPNIIYLMIDEGDHGFHPHWQKALVNTLINYLKFFAGVRFQIFLTSHSPVILSDIPGSNIVFLNKKDNKTSVLKNNGKPETFGANIHSLFRDTFFIRDGVIGKFAEQKIQSLIDRVSKVDDHTKNDIVEDLLKEIELIGEPILRKTLTDDTLKKSSDQIAINHYEKEIERLKAKKND